MEDRKIILIQDLLDHRKRKEDELAFYTKKREELEKKLFFIQADINLTEKIIKMIEKEKVEEIKK